MELDKKPHLNLFPYLGIFFLFVAFLLPGHHLPFSSFQQEFLSFVSLMVLVLWLIVNLKGSIKVSATALVVLIVSSIPLIQYFFGVSFLVWRCFFGINIFNGIILHNYCWPEHTQGFI